MCKRAIGRALGPRMDIAVDDARIVENLVLPMVQEILELKNSSRCHSVVGKVADLDRCA